MTARPIVLGTAGHIDHGKTTLVKALTGIDTDRLKEEKERGISIDLGFAYLDAAGGERAGIVDVPGHERFIRNMLAGAHGMDLVLFTVAADDGVMPQTEEHLDILHLLGVRRGLFVITKIDLADAGDLERRLRRLNPTAEILEASFGEIEPGALFGGTERDLRDLSFDEHTHHDGVRACCLVFDEPLDWTGFVIWLTMLLQSRGQDVLRVKGLLDVGGPGPLVLNGVQHVIHPPVHLDGWPDEDHRSRIVFIGRGFTGDELERSLAAFNRAARATQ